MKVKVDIITGFLGAGKTSFCNEYLQTKEFNQRNVLYIQLEQGEINLETKEGILFKSIPNEDGLSSSLLLQWIYEYQPDYIIIEANGMRYLDEIFKVFKGPEVKKRTFIRHIYNCINGKQWEIYMRNFKDLFFDQFNNSDIIVLNQRDYTDKEEINIVKAELANLKSGCKIWEITDADNFNSSGDDLENDNIDRHLEGILPFVLSISMIYILFTLINPYINLSLYGTIFVGLLLEAIPFLLIGSMISALIQVFVSEEWITKWFPKNKTVGFLVALGAGVFFPVCDCAIIPIMRRLIKKGIPISIAITFMLAAPIVDPVVILSTFYAFWSNTMVVYYRIILGLIIALLVGLIFSLVQKKKDILKEDVNLFLCQCGYCQLETTRPYPLKDKIKAVFQHGGSEFLGIGRFFVIAAMVSTAIQLYLPDNLVEQLSQKEGLSLIIMMLAAFIMSICSTSDAFLAQSLGSVFPISSIMGFLVFGALLDIKNLMILLSLFKKRFVIKLTSIITLVSLIVLSIFVVLL
ncbi:hypothetical protein EDC18_10156 [Natranaerovirga pectinivora]|uniref:CobW/HypB/UreG nucleotide-binding domain-containing protein n=1 Tax=Natranaerovirga pectinivora TaxID=682400 RepID=A0A4R3MNG6_9FIRM|nr:permease [Natranaerovirga pectinivora]TCT16761.1 hypothetical protein EDC18_10156 [Natranaerovirga pectinivora]